jgi:hypothetical protein
MATFSSTPTQFQEALVAAKTFIGSAPSSTPRMSSFPLIPSKISMLHVGAFKVAFFKKKQNKFYLFIIICLLYNPQLFTFSP